MTWDIDAVGGPNFVFPEKSTHGWTDGGAGNNKLSLVDLTGRHSTALNNDGSTSHRQGRGWAGRRETCVVNAAIMKSKYPHVGGKQFNKPIVVDVDLPVCQTDEPSHAEV